MNDPIFKAELHIPTEQYGFVAITVEGSATELVEAYRATSDAFKGGVGISDKEFNQVLDNMLLDNGQNQIETWEKMSAEQRRVAQCLKRSLKRIEARNPPPNNH